MTEQILACPYCGNELLETYDDGESYYVFCSSCGAQGPLSKDKSDAILLWNAAANALAAKDAEIERLKEEIAWMSNIAEHMEAERDEARRVAKLFHGGIKAIERYANDWIVILDTDTRTEPPTRRVDATEERE